jgi:hypothetical protein
LVYGIPYGVRARSYIRWRLKEGKPAASTRALLETGPHFRPGALIPRIRVEIGQPSVKKRAFLRCDGDVLFGEGLPQRLNELEAIAWAELQGLRKEVRVHIAGRPSRDRIVTSSA